MARRLGYRRGRIPPEYLYPGWYPTPAQVRARWRFAEEAKRRIETAREKYGKLSGVACVEYVSSGEKRILPMSAAIHCLETGKCKLVAWAPNWRTLQAQLVAMGVKI